MASERKVSCSLWARRLLTNLLYDITERLTTTKNTASISATLQQVYLENSILALSIISLGLLILIQFSPNFLELRQFTMKDHRITNGRANRCVYLETGIRRRPMNITSGIISVEKIVNQAWNKIYPQERSEKLRNMLNEILEQWLNYSAIWPLDAVCTVLVIGLDVLRRILRRYRKPRDGAIMFGMIFILLAASVIRTVELRIHLWIIQKMNRMVQDLNYALDEVAANREDDMEMIICVEPPAIHLILCITNIFLALLQITFLMDYLDPT